MATSMHVSYARGDDELQEIIDAVDIETWMDGEGVRYRITRGASGAQLNVQTCPLCGNDKYKVYINAATGLGNCFAGSCEQKFNKFKFIGAHLGTEARGTIEHMRVVAREQGWRAPRRAAALPDVAPALIMPDSIALPHGGRNLKYLDKRNITGAVASYFGLRYCIKGHFAYLDEAGRERRQDYSGRILIPVYDMIGCLVSFQGRDVTGNAEKKYLFPPGFAATGTHVLNGHNAIGARDVCVGEGAFDVFALKIALDGEQALRDVVPVGSFGKHFSHGDDASQLAKLVRMKEAGLRQVTLMWDAEPKAISAMVETGLRLSAMGLVARIALLPPGRDPNEVAPNVVRAAYWQAEVVTPALATRLLLTRCHERVSAT